MGRGRDLFRTRKQNTSRPPSMHVDDFMNNPRVCPAAVSIICVVIITLSLSLSLEVPLICPEEGQWFVVVCPLRV